MIRLKKWLPIALCCVPAVAIAAAVGIGIAVGGVTLGASYGGPLGLTLITLALLVCPLHMGWMMWRMRRQPAATGRASGAVACCPPATQRTAVAADTLERVEVLHRRREALEQEVMVLLQTAQTQTAVEQ